MNINSVTPLAGGQISPERLAEIALSVVATAGVTVGQLRIAQHDTRGVGLRDGKVENVATDTSIALSVRVVKDGAWGFAATTDLTEFGAKDTANRAVEMAKLSAAVSTDRVELVDEPSYGKVSWRLPIAIDPMLVSDEQVIELLKSWHEKVAAHSIVHHVDVHAAMGKDITFFADLTGNLITQERDRTSAQLTAVHVSESGFDDMRTCAPPAGRGFEYLQGQGWNWDDELTNLPEYLSEKTKAPSVTAGKWDLVIDPTNLWLTIHESIGHATELDRALGYEANYAGSSFATIDKLNNFKYGSEIMNVTGDRNAPHGLSTVGYDDEGVAAQQWDLIKDGTLVGYQTDRNIAKKIGLTRSNGCAFADSALHSPIQRMPNVSLQPGVEDLSNADLIAGVDRGIYIVGDKSWSIDMQRYNFQFTGQRFYEIKDGKLVGQLKDVVYQSRTPDFWASMSAVGGIQTYLLGGALNCGKGQPGQTAPVSHGCPTAVFRQINVLNGKEQAGA
jgi:TldD protein